MVAKITENRGKWAVLSLICVVFCCFCTARASEPVQLHDPHIIASGDYYYIFATGRRGSLVQSFRSPDLLHWQRTDAVFDEIPDWVRQHVPECRGFWAPAIYHVDGQYRLYYSASTFGSQRSLIGLATNSTLDADDPEYGWQDEGMVIASEPGMSFNAIDAGILSDADGGLWMVFGSFWGGIKMTELDRDTGKPISAEPEIHVVARRESPPNAIEAAYVIYRQGYYYLFVSFDHCCRGVNSDYKIMVGRSEDITGPYVDAQGRSLLEGGGTLVLEGCERFAGTGHNSVLQDEGMDFLVYHAYAFELGGRSILQIRPLDWDERGWPVVQEPLEGVSLVEPADD